VFSDPLPSNGHGADNRKHFVQYLFCCCVRVLRALPRNVSTCHNIIIVVLKVCDLRRLSIKEYLLSALFIAWIKATATYQIPSVSVCRQKEHVSILCGPLVMNGL
jgi:hypothetical protein